MKVPPYINDIYKQGGFARLFSLTRLTKARDKMRNILPLVMT